MKILTTILCVFFVLPVSAQTWYITRGLSTDEVAWGVDVDAEDNVYWAVEEKNEFPYWYYNINLFKINPSGQQIWQSEPWGETFNDIAFKVTVEGSNVYLSGRIDSTALPNSGDALVLSYTTNGNLNWQYHFNALPDYGYEEIDGLIVQTDGIYLSGWTQAAATNDMNFLIQKISLDGQLIWSKSWDYNNLQRFDGANGHMAMDDNFLYVAGHVNRNNIASLDGDAALVCFDRNNGDYLWHVTWGGALYDDALGMTMSSDSMLYVVGYTASFGNGSQTYLNKYTRTGQLLWSRLWGGSGTEDARSVVADGDSIVYVAGATASYGNGGKDVFLLKFNANGVLLDTLLWGGTYDETIQDVVMNGEYLYLTGTTSSYGNGQISGDHKTDGLLLKLNGRTMQAAAPNIIASLNKPNSAELYPNPCHDYLTIKNNNVYQTKYDFFIVYDLFGNAVFQEKFIPLNETINIDLPKGIYFYKLFDKMQKNLGNGKIIIQ